MIVKRLALVGAWVALWGDITVANILWGVVLTFVLTSLVPDRIASGVRLRPLAVARLTGFMIVNLITSTATVARAVVRPTPDRVCAEIITVPLRTRSSVVASVVANSITMTPGTMTLSAHTDPFTLDVHVLGRVDHDEFTQRIAHLETLVSRAFSMETTS